MTTAAASPAVPPAAGQPSGDKFPGMSGSGCGPTPPGQGSSSVEVHHEGDTIVIFVRDHLDHSVGAALVEAATAAVGSRGAERLDIDLRQLASFTTEGADALVSCRTLGSQLSDGLHYRTGRGAGRSALLSAYRACDTGEMQAINVEQANGTTTHH